MALILSAPGIARGAAATCDQAFTCFDSNCSESDLLTGIGLGAVDGVGELLCFVGDPKCSCFQEITSDLGGSRSNEWAMKVDEILDQCEGSPSGGRSLSGVAFEAASGVCTPTFADDVQPLLNDRCGVCHVQGSSGNFNFSAGISALVNAPSAQSNLVYVRPGAPQESYLFHKILGTQGTVGGSGGRMPLGGTLPKAEEDVINAWILGGAQP